ncbi:hypothetical protein AB7M49_006094 [Bradyrhizobium elkanii]
MKKAKTKKPDVNATLRANGADAVRARHDEAHRKQHDQGAALLDDVRRFLKRFVSYPTMRIGNSDVDHASVAHTLWIGHTHMMESWESTPRLAFLSPEPASGKTRALEVTELLVPRPVSTMNASPSYLFRKCGDENGTPTLLHDEVDAIFGPKAREHEDVRAFLNSGHRRGATFGRCVMRGKTVETEEIQSYAAVALAGLGWLPDTIMSRAVVIRMRRRTLSEAVEPFRHREHAPQGEELRRRLEQWSGTVVDQAEQARPDIPLTIEDRNADCWEALLAVADLAGGEWPELARNAAIAIVAASQTTAPPSLNLLLLSDLRIVFASNLLAVKASLPHGLPTKDTLEALLKLEDGPWSQLGKEREPLKASGLAYRLRDYDVKPKNLRPTRSDDGQCKGYHLADLADAWRRYLSPIPENAVPDVPAVTTEIFQRFFVTGPRDDVVPEDVGPSQGTDQANGESSTTSEAGTFGTAGTAFSQRQREGVKR